MVMKIIKKINRLITGKNNIMFDLFNQEETVKPFDEEVKFTGTMYNIHSSNATKVGFCFSKKTNCGVMRVVFKGNKTYDYYPIIKNKFSEIFSEESKGSWIQKNLVKNKDMKYVEVIT